MSILAGSLNQWVLQLQLTMPLPLPVLPIKHGCWQWWTGNTRGSMSAVKRIEQKMTTFTEPVGFPKCFWLNTATFLWKITIRWAAFKIGSLKAFKCHHFDLKIQLWFLELGFYECWHSFWYCIDWEGSQFKVICPIWI